MWCLSLEKIIISGKIVDYVYYNKNSFEKFSIASQLFLFFIFSTLNIQKKQLKNKNV